MHDNCCQGNVDRSAPMYSLSFGNVVLIFSVHDLLDEASPLHHPFTYTPVSAHLVSQARMVIEAILAGRTV